MIDHCILHGNLKWNNIGYRLVDGKYIIIPFNFSLSKYVNFATVDIIKYIKVDYHKLITDTMILKIEDTIKLPLIYNDVTLM
jgi:hypothetical protein